MLLFAVLQIALAVVTPQTFVLQAEQDVWDVAAEDFNGDGVKDLIALCADAEGRPLVKEIAVFLSADGGFGTRPDFRLTLAPETGTAFLAEVDGAAPRELVITGPGAADVYSYGDDLTKTASVAMESLLPVGSRKPLFLDDVATDLDGDGIDEWLIPVAGGYAVYRKGELAQRVITDVVSEYLPLGSGVVRHQLPSVRPFDQPDSEVKGLAFLSSEFADFAYGPDWREQRRFALPERLDETWDNITRLEDIDQNGIPDLVVTQVQGTINMRVQTQVFLARGAFDYPANPSAHFETKGAMSSPFLRDVDGDEDLDLIFVKIPIGVRTIINYFIRSKITVRGEVYVFDNGRFPSEPSFATTITLDAPDGNEQVVYAFGDFTGDGRLDAAFGKSATELALHEGNAEDFLSSKPWQTLNIPGFGAANRFDLNDNGREDLTIHHPESDDSRRIDVIMF